MIRCAITDGSRFGTDPATAFGSRFAGLREDAQRWASAGVDFVQLREKDLTAGQQLMLTEALMKIFRESGSKTKLLINSRADIALAAAADGVHLTSAADALTVAQVRSLFSAAVLVSASCHTLQDIHRQRDADLLLFGPVFEKRIAGKLVVQGVGLIALQQACAVAGKVPVLALGGVNDTNLNDCLTAGAAGIAAIRLFNEKTSPH